MKTHFYATWGCLVLFLVPSPTGSYRNFLPCSHWKLCCFFLGDFTKSHSKVIFFDFTCVWVLFRSLTQISMLNHVPYFSNIGNRVKYQNVNSLFFNLGSLFLFPVLLSTASFRNLQFRFWFLTPIAMLKKVPQPQLTQIYASGQRVSPRLRFK